MKFVGKTNKAAASNRKHLLPGTDGRSRRGRRFRDLVASLSADIGPFEGLPEEAAILVKQAATMLLAAESYQAQAVSGQDVDMGALLEVNCALERLLKELRELRERRAEAEKTLNELAPTP